MISTKQILAMALAGTMALSMAACGGSSAPPASQSGGSASVGGSSDFPNKVVQVIVPFAAGGGADISVRTLSKYAEESLGQKIVIQNVTGGSGTVGLTQLASAVPDGYTLGYFASTNSNDNLLFEGIQYGVDSFEPILKYSADPHIIVASKKSGITDIASLLETGKANPGELSLALGGAWTSHDFLRISLEQKLDINFKRIVYQGGSEAITAVASGDVDLAVPFVSEAIPQIQAGNVIPVAITSAERFDVVPDIPTIKEQGVDYTHTMWRGLVAPVGTPQEVVDELVAAFESAWNNPDYQAEAKAAGIMAELCSGEEFKTFYLENHETYKEMIESGLE
ncbi:tripartite tricarboxylate transporter substrate binding protein [Oscillibacter sp.]|uniref:tripartite tricarboxylate transporter substrate binding protein n=1 Tax=Oscillibacter sp. TaxID=1945593 RepID=UPI00289A8C24|nr:tripartite tricarboxylate transporter substrate binding protein [Oscillibacter sp.]